MRSQLKILLFTILCFLLAKGHAQDLLETNAWSTYEGTIGNNKAQLTLYMFKNNKIKGNYIFENTNKKFSLEGYLKGNAVFLTEVNHGKNGFKGNLFTGTLDKFSGSHTDTSQNKTLKFEFQLSTITWGDYLKRYTDMYGSDEEIESFMNTIKTAILTDNKLWIANHLHYPTSQVLSKGFTSINTKYQLIKYYNQIFTAKFKNKVKLDYTTNLFNKDSEAMLGNGEIWISNTPGSNQSKYDFMISSISPVN